MNNQWLYEKLKAFEAYYAHYLEEIDAPLELKSAMKYSALNGGKRVRALLTIATGAIFQTEERILFPIAAAIEMIHSYSLVHDDLPAMDDDDMRRGQPSCHRQYDEATAILVGDALLSESFSLLSRIDLPAEKVISLIKLISDASGASGMVGGQFDDLDAEKRRISLEQLQSIHQRKTGAIIKASILSALIASSSREEDYQHFSNFATEIGLAFQIKDDILDVEGTTEALGKVAGRDEAQQKSTYTSLLGLDGAKKALQTSVEHAKKLFQHYPNHSEPLAALTTYILERNH